MTPQAPPLIVPLFIPHRGCPHQCVFCNQGHITGADRNLSPEDVAPRTMAFLNRCRPSARPVEIAFYGGNFLGLPSETVNAFLSAATKALQTMDGGGIRFSTRPDTISPATLRLLDGFPVKTVELGAQSMSDAVLDRSGRGHTANDTCRAMCLLKKRGVETGLQIMTGLPGDTDATSLDTASRAAALSPHFVRIYPTVVLADSPLAACYRQGAYAPWTLARTVAVVKHMVSVFTRKRIRIIRMGLQPTEDLGAHTGILAGPFHPAFGHLVQSALMYDRAAALLDAAAPQQGTEVRLAVHPRTESRLRGLRNENLRHLEKQFGLKRIQVVREADMDQDRVAMDGRHWAAAL